MATVPPRPLLVELFVEELPPKVLPRLAAAFADGIAAGLRAESLLEANAIVASYATPRRLAVLIDAVAGRAADRPVSHKLMPASVGLTVSGEAMPALLKKLAALGADATVVPRLQRRLDGKSETLFLDAVAAGASLAEGLQRALDRAIAQLPIPKVMQYQLEDGWTSVSFVRPAHGLVALHGDEIVPVRALGLDAGRTTHGHRFEGSRAPIVVRDATSYAAQLRDEGAVIAGFAERKDETLRQLQAAAAAAHLALVDDDALLDEVTALVELPNVLTCRFDPEFLAVPPECLVLTMKANQKYFPLLDAEGRLTNRFLVVSNIAPADPSRIVEGNERVVRPRLADAKFFYDQDRKRTLESRVPGLDKVVYHGKLGSQGDRVRRVRRIAAAIVEGLSAIALATDVDRAASLAKADLTTDMVGEFPELQGVMGRYYALAEGESEEVAFAIEDHYRPKFSGDGLPRNQVGVVLALADKLETVTGLFAAGERPTGDKDPYALRRNALGIVRLLVERKLPFSLADLFKHALEAFPRELAQASWPEPSQFVLERAKGYFAEQGLQSRAIEAVLGPAGMGTVLSELAPIVQSADRFIATAAGQQLATANKRITNILRKSDFDVPMGFSPRALKQQVDPTLFKEDHERALYMALQTIGKTALELREKGRYADSLDALVPLSEPVRLFFENVMVNADDEIVRDNRIRLLQHARAYMNQVADLSIMAG